MFNALEPGDLEEALVAAKSIGDNILYKNKHKVLRFLILLLTEVLNSVWNGLLCMVLEMVIFRIVRLSDNCYLSVTAFN